MENHEHTVTSQSHTPSHEHTQSLHEHTPHHFTITEKEEIQREGERDAKERAKDGEIVEEEPRTRTTDHSQTTQDEQTIKNREQLPFPCPTPDAQ